MKNKELLKLLSLEKSLVYFTTSLKSNEKDEPMVFILWGRNARNKKMFITNDKHLIIESAHPSPLSAYNGFFGSKPFSRTNDFLMKNGFKPIDWQIHNLSSCPEAE